jgi:hypothetical protein
VSEAFSGAIVFPSEEYLQALTGVAAMLPSSLPREHDEEVCCELAHAIEALLVRVARGQGALDVAIASRLERIERGGPLRLGFSSIGDYARERHGLPASSAEKMVRFSRELRTRPLLRQAVWNGEVSTRKAETVLRAARGDDEATWVARAREQTVRALHEALKSQTATGGDERWELLCAHVPPDLRCGLEDGMKLAAEQLGANASKWQRFRAMCEEVVGTYGAPEVDSTDDEARSTESADATLQEFLEQESAKWAALGEPAPITAPGPSLDLDADLRRTDEELCELMTMRRGWDELFGRLAFLFHAAGGWHRLGFASFGHHCTERLGMKVRAVQQRIALERRLQECPSLRQALRTQRVSYEKARLIARYADAASVDRWIEVAERTTCIDLKRLLEHDEDVQMCARREFRVWVPVSDGALVSAAFRAIRKAAGRPLTPGECIGLIAAHFAKVWKAHGRQRKTLQKRILARDRGLCCVPGCSKAAAHAHHVDYRSAGGSDDPDNLISVCAAHHLHGIHMGWVRVRRVGVGRLRWQLGVRPGFAPLIDVTVRAPWCADEQAA